MKTFETEKHNIPEGATHYSNEDAGNCFAWYKRIDGVKCLWMPGYFECWDIMDDQEAFNDSCVKPIPQTNIETPEEKEALDLIDTTPHQYEMSKFSGKKEIEWSDSDKLPPVGCEVMTSYTDDGCDDWCDFHGPGVIIAYHGDYVWVAHHGKFNRVHELCSIEFEKVEKESPQQREERERLEAAYDLYCVWVGDRVGHHAIDFNEWKIVPDYYKKWLRIVDKTNYRKEQK